MNNVRDLKFLLLSWKTCILVHLNAWKKCSCHGLRVVATVFDSSLLFYFSVVCYQQVFISSAMLTTHNFRCNVKIPAKMPRYLKVGVKLFVPRRLHAVKYAWNPRHWRVNSPSIPGIGDGDFNWLVLKSNSQSWDALSKQQCFEI